MLSEYSEYFIVNEKSPDILNKAGRRADECARMKTRMCVAEIFQSARAAREAQDRTAAAGIKREAGEEGGVDTEPLLKLCRRDPVVQQQCEPNLETLSTSERALHSSETINTTCQGEPQTGGDDNLMQACLINEAAVGASLPSAQEGPDPSMKEILTARLENCLIELGSPRENVRLAGSMLVMARSLNLPELKSICTKVFSMSSSTVVSSRFLVGVITKIVVNIGRQLSADRCCWRTCAWRRCSPCWRCSPRQATRDLTPWTSSSSTCRCRHSVNSKR